MINFFSFHFALFTFWKNLDKKNWKVGNCNVLTNFICFLLVLLLQIPAVGQVSTTIIVFTVVGGLRSWFEEQRADVQWQWIGVLHTEVKQGRIRDKRSDCQRQWTRACWINSCWIQTKSAGTSWLLPALRMYWWKNGADELQRDKCVLAWTSN